MTWPALLLIALAFVGVAIRVVNITQPFVDFWCWRQSDVAMIAENFYRNGLNILFPQINWAGSTPGYVGTEFQLVPFLAALLYVPFGVHEWVGRAVPVVFFAASLPCFFLLVRKVSTGRAAVAALSFYVGAPVSIFSSRSFMPDMPSLSLALIAFYLFTRWLDQDRHSFAFTGASAALALALLVKISIATVGVAFLYLAFATYGRAWIRVTRLWALAILAALPSVAWYAHAYYLSISHPPYHFFGAGGLGLASLEGYRKIFGQIAFASLTPPVTALALFGLFVRPRSSRGYAFHFWLIGVLIFIVTAARRPHQWYYLALVPISAALAGIAFDHLADPLVQAWGRGVAACVGIVLYLSVACFAYDQVVPLYQPWATPALHGGMAVRRTSPPDALVAVVDAGDPTTIYYSGRKGWHFPRNFGGAVAQDSEAIRELEALRREGARYLVLLRDTKWWLDHYADFGRHVSTLYPRREETDDYVIFDLLPPP
jgi:4-amino-4-deoxy-L-arabinose transferase-like glycosyltransferase